MKKLILIALLGLTLVSATPTKEDDEFMEKLVIDMQKQLPMIKGNAVAVSLIYYPKSHTLFSQEYLDINKMVNGFIARFGKPALIRDINELGIMKKMYLNHARDTGCKPTKKLGGVLPKGVTIRIVRTLKADAIDDMNITLTSFNGKWCKVTWGSK